ncbi:CWC25 [Candida pseudojiufengensis]|uniref:CWC25 n=1 Tax=Candida pseudojiufengensis TaxID=497109 RepID=UPI002223F1A9|nr:CWC25 [Candida pseudojiufengensis]KAI5964233.1 CWC25 [Candida pseudojiufengensis]
MAGDLNLKKSWNPKLVKNQTKVWELEQKKLKQLKEDQLKNEESKKEQEYIDLLKLQYGDNYKDHLSTNEKLKVNKLSWMYDDVPFEAPEAEETKNTSGFIESNLEFTDGKKEVESLLNGNQAFNKRESRGSNGGNDRLNKIIGSGLSKSSSNSSALDNDPLAMMKRQQQQQRRSRIPGTEISSSSSSNRIHKPDDKHRHRSQKSSRPSSHSHHNPRSSSHQSHHSSDNRSSHRSHDNRSSHYRSRDRDPISSSARS